MQIALPAAGFGPAAAHAKASSFPVRHVGSIHHTKQRLQFKPEEVNSIDDRLHLGSLSLFTESELERQDTVKAEAEEPDRQHSSQQTQFLIYL